MPARRRHDPIRVRHLDEKLIHTGTPQLGRLHAALPQLLVEVGAVAMIE